MVTLYPNEEDPDQKKVFINGVKILEPTQLNHDDRILFGNHNYMMFVMPGLDHNEEFDWAFASKEVHKDAVDAFKTTEEDEAMKKKIQDMED